MKNGHFQGILFSTTVVALIFIFSEFSLRQPDKSSGYKNNSCKVKIIAHRGAWKKKAYPQNSLASLRNAIRLKTEGSEFDVRITSDDSLIINHDGEYNKMVIEKTPYNELVRFPLSNGEKLPTLREYITEGLKHNSYTRLICELKASTQGRERNIFMAEKSVQLARELNAIKRISWISFNYDIVKRISEIEPDAEVFYLNGDMTPSALKSEGIKGAGYQYSVFKKNPEFIDEAKKLGILLNVWTVNNPDDMDWFISHCFNYITTDEPELLKERIKALK